MNGRGIKNIDRSRYREDAANKIG